MIKYETDWQKGKENISAPFFALINGINGRKADNGPADGDD